MNNRLLEIEPRLLRYNLMLTQGILLILALFFGWLFHTSYSIRTLFEVPAWKYIWLSICLSTIIIGVNILLDRYAPRHWTEDGEINQRIFQDISVAYTLVLCLLVGFSEELLFRGVIHYRFGNVWASVVFTLVHFRYLRKPILIGFVFATSYSLGILFEESGSLLPSILAHTIVDFSLALIIRKQASKKTDAIRHQSKGGESLDEESKE